MPVEPTTHNDKVSYQTIDNGLGEKNSLLISQRAKIPVLVVMIKGRKLTFLEHLLGWECWDISSHFEIHSCIYWVALTCQALCTEVRRPRLSCVFSEKYRMYKKLVNAMGLKGYLLLSKGGCLVTRDNRENMKWNRPDSVWASNTCTVAGVRRGPGASSCDEGVFTVTQS